MLSNGARPHCGVPESGQGRVVIPKDRQFNSRRDSIINTRAVRRRSKDEVNAPVFKDGGPSNSPARSRARTPARSLGIAAPSIDHMTPLAV